MSKKELDKSESKIRDKIPNGPYDTWDNINIEKLIKHLERKWSSNKCPMCGFIDWNFSGILYRLRTYQDIGLVTAKLPTIPIFPVTCGNCGNTVLINAIVAGIFKQSEKENKK